MEKIWDNFLQLQLIKLFDVLTQNYQIQCGNTWGGGLFFEGQSHPTPRGRGPSALQFGGSFLFMPTPFVPELPNLTW